MHNFCFRRKKSGVEWAGPLEQGQAQEGAGIRMGRFDLGRTLPTLAGASATSASCRRCPAAQASGGSRLLAEPAHSRDTAAASSCLWTATRRPWARSTWPSTPPPAPAPSTAIGASARSARAPTGKRAEPKSPRRHAGRARIALAFWSVPPESFAARCSCSRC